MFDIYTAQDLAVAVASKMLVGLPNIYSRKPSWLLVFCLFIVIWYLVTATCTTLLLKCIHELLFKGLMFYIKIMNILFMVIWHWAYGKGPLI